MRTPGLLPAFPSRALLLLLAALGALLVLACNPFAGDSEETSAADSEGVVEVGLDRSSADNNPDAQGTEQPAEEAGVQSRQTPSAPTPEPSPAAESAEAPEATAEPSREEAAGSGSTDAGSEEALDLVWAFLSQCVALGVNDLQANQVNGQWFVQAAGESPDRYGIWKVDPATGSVQPHNIRARQWGPRINSQCTQETFAEFYLPTPAPRSDSEVTEAGQAVTSLWATLVKCYPAMRPEDLQATLNPARGEWIVTARPEVATNYGVWTVRGNGEVLPYNRHAQGIYEQLDTGLC